MLAGYIYNQRVDSDIVGSCCNEAMPKIGGETIDSIEALDGVVDLDEQRRAGLELSVS